MSTSTENKYYYIRNRSSGQAITVDSNSHHYVTLQTVSTTASSRDLQLWHLNSKGQIKSKAKPNDRNYCLTMNKGDNDTHILALQEGDSSLTDDKSIFEVTGDGAIRNVHYGYSMHKVNDNRDEVGHDTVKAENRAKSSDRHQDFQWAWIPVDHEYGLAITSRPTTAGGLLGGTVTGALDPGCLRLYIYRQTDGSNGWEQVGSPITPRPSGSWAVNLTGAREYGIALVVKDIVPSRFPDQIGGDVLARQTFTAAAPANNYAATLANEGLLVKLDDFPFEFVGEQNFTVEMWVQMTGPGGLFSTIEGALIDGTPTPSAQNWNGILLGVEEQGKISFGITSQREAPYPTARFESNPTLVSDGSWHHVAAMRMGDELAVFLDGTLLKGEQAVYNSTNKNEKLDKSETGQIVITNQKYASLGGAYAMQPNPDQSLPTSTLPYTLPDCGFKGSIDNARVWKKALTPYQVRSGMYEPVDDNDPELLGNWSFDTQDATNSAQHYQYTAYINNATTFDGEDVVQALSGKQPYLTAQCKLMEDYTDPNNLKSTTDTYHSVLSVCDANGNRMPNTLFYLKADRSCTIYGLEKGQITRHQIDGTLRMFTSNAMGEFSFSCKADENLTAPMFSIQTDFMASDEWLLIFPDRHLHHSLATLTGEKLLNDNPQSNLSRTLKDNNVNLETANALAAAVNNLMASALEHDVQADYPMIMLVDEPAETVFAPVPRLYQNIANARRAYNPKSDVASLHYTRIDDQQRIPSGDAMPVKHWSYSDNVFSILDQAQVQAKCKASVRPPVFLNTAAAVNQAMLDSGKSRFTREEIATLVTQYSSRSAVAMYSPSDLWDDIKQAGSVIVSAVEYVIDGAEKTLQVISLVIDEYKYYVLQTVEDAVNAIKGLFAKLGVVVTDIIDFLSSVFAWDDILETQKVLKRYLQGSVPTIQSQVGMMKSKVLSGLEDIKHTVDQRLDSALSSMPNESLGDAQTRATSADPQDIQSSYILRSTTTCMNSEDSNLPAPSLSSTDQNTLKKVFEDLVAAVSADAEQFNSVLKNTPSFAALFSDPQAFMRAALDDVIAAVRLLWDVAFDLLEAGVAGVFDAFSAILGAINKMMNTHIQIPFVTKLYEEVINPNSTMTAYDLVALMGAAPLTVTYKLVHGGKLPFDPQSQEVQNFMALSGDAYPQYFSGVQKGATAKQASDDEEMRLKLSWGIGYTCGVITLAGSVCTAVLDRGLGALGLRFFGSVVMITQLVTFVCSIPFYLEPGVDHLADFNAFISLSFAIPLIIDGMEFLGTFTAGSTNWLHKFPAWEPAIKPAISIVMGVFHTLAFIASAGWETEVIATGVSGATRTTLELGDLWATATLNIVSIIPELDKVLHFAGKPGAILMTDLISFDLWGIGTIALTSGEMITDIETVIH